MAISDVEKQRFFYPRKPDEKIKTRKDKFDALLRFVAERNGWLTSIPGAASVTLECLPESALPDELRDLGHDVTEIGEGERILPQAIVEHVLVEGSSGVRRPVRHAGIQRVLRFTFRLDEIR